MMERKATTGSEPFRDLPDERPVQPPERHSRSDGSFPSEFTACASWIFAAISVGL